MDPCLGALPDRRKTEHGVATPISCLQTFAFSVSARGGSSRDSVSRSTTPIIRPRSIRGRSLSRDTCVLQKARLARIVHPSIFSRMGEPGGDCMRPQALPSRRPLREGRRLVWRVGQPVHVSRMAFNPLRSWSRPSEGIPTQSLLGRHGIVTHGGGGDADTVGLGVSKPRSMRRHPFVALSRSGKVAASSNEAPRVLKRKASDIRSSRSQ